MGLKVALASGGKDSLYAAYREWPVDVFIFLVYEFPVLSPHIVNLKAAIASLSSTGVPVLIVRVSRGSNGGETVEALRRLGASVLVAGDVYVEDHLRYLEDIASRAGVKLREPLWGMDTRELLYKITSEGFQSRIIGVKHEYRELLGELISRETAERLDEILTSKGGDPLGEQGEYHSVVTSSPLHPAPLRLGEHEGVIDDGYHYILRVDPLGPPWSPASHPPHAEPQAGDKEG